MKDEDILKLIDDLFIMYAKEYRFEAKQEAKVMIDIHNTFTAEQSKNCS